MKCTLASPQSDWVYPRVMQRKPTGQAPPPEPRAGENESGAEAGELYGIVELTRQLKDDGRALIVFRRPAGR
jgi:hypothetical protein